MKLGPYLLGPNDDENCGIYTGDALVLMKQLPDSSIDVVMTDPPYSLTSASSRRSANKAMGWADINNAATWFSLWYAECWRILKKTGCFWTFCSWQSLPVVQCAASHVPGMHLTSVLVWDKCWPSVGSMCGLRQYYELVALIRKPAFRINDRKVGDIWQQKWTSHKPTGVAGEKPVALIRRILDVCEIPENGIVLDAFIGSGTTAVASGMSGRSYLGFEIDASIATLARERVRQTQPPLFVPEPVQEELML